MKIKALYSIGAVLLFLSCAQICTAQSYALFNPASKKLFTTYPSPYTTYSIAFDSVFITGTDTTYYNFFGLNNIYHRSDSCPFWGAPDCIQQNYPSWIGQRIEHASSGIYRFFTIKGDTLTFNLNLSPGDTSLFYQDSIQYFSIIYDYADTISVFGNTDSAKYFRVWHTDTSGAPISSALQQQKVIVAKDWGLARFFQIDSFPWVLNPLQLIGNVSPDGGMNKITSEMVYDYQPGDEVQINYRGSCPCGGCPPSATYSIYVKYRYLSRTVSIDSLIYLTERHYFADTFKTELIDTIYEKYYKHDTISAIPFEFFNRTQRSLTYKDYCNQRFWTYYMYNANNTGYCSKENCWGSIDVFPDPYTYETIYVSGVGIYKRNSSPMIFCQRYPSSASQVVYFKKNGSPCGKEAFVGIHELIINNNSLLIYPNPAQGMFTIELPETVNSGVVRIYNVLGEAAYQSAAGNKQGIATSAQGGFAMTISMEKLPAGIYLVQLSSGERVWTGRVVVE